ncbi:MAG: extracellular solute-binding protein [Hyphomicrobiales bacterium]|nr:extracellular solute-binding protein [Hyphomicrobiales bacterium]
MSERSRQRLRQPLRHRCAPAAIAAGLAVLATAATGAEIDPKLIAAAKKEGQLTYYTDLIVEQAVRPLVAAFEPKFGIKVHFTRGDSQVNAVKILNEYRAGRVQSDVFGMTSGFHVLVDAGAVRQFTTANGDELPPQYRDPNRYWVSSHIYVMTPGVNTSLVPQAQRPQSYEDLLLPYWTNKMVWKPNDMSGAPGFVANVLLSMGEERGMAYLRRLAKQNIKMVNASARAILDQVIGGEYPMSLQIFNHHAAISAKKGAPVDWVRLSPSIVTPNLLGLPKNSPRPNAGQLFIEFMTSPEGQAILQRANYLPSRPDVPPLIPELIPEKGGFQATVVTPEIQAKYLDHWDKVVATLFK